MSYEWGPKNVESYPAGQDLSTSQFLIGVLNASRAVVLASAAGQGTGIIDFTVPATPGKTVGLVTGGTTKVVAGGTITVGQPLVANASGQAIAATTGQKAFGTARENAVAGQVFAAIVDFSGAGTV